MAKDYDKEQLLIDWKMGNYTCRELAAKYKISPSMIVKLTKAHDKRLGELVNKQVDIKQELKTFSKQEVNAFTNEVSKREMELNLLDNLVLSNLKEMATKFPDFDAQGHRSAAVAIDQGYVSLRLAPRHANQTLNVQNNVTSKETIELNTSSWTTEDFASISRLLPSENH